MFVAVESCTSISWLIYLDGCGVIDVLSYYSMISMVVLQSFEIRTQIRIRWCHAFLYFCDPADFVEFIRCDVIGRIPCCKEWPGNHSLVWFLLKVSIWWSLGVGRWGMWKWTWKIYIAERWYVVILWEYLLFDCNSIRDNSCPFGSIASWGVAVVCSCLYWHNCVDN